MCLHLLTGSARGVVALCTVCRQTTAVCLPLDIDRILLRSDKSVGDWCRARAAAAAAALLLPAAATCCCVDTAV